ncbi:hypothetical protein ACNOYE_14295 [Nannocystaceae bacterium ST9]
MSSDKGSSHGYKCPSSPLHGHASILGLVQRDGQVAFLGEPLPVDEEFIETATHGASVGTRFRFSGKCMESGCARWNVAERNCEVAISVLHQIRPKAMTSLPSCGIRAACRWHAQEGDRVCAICPEVIYDGIFTRQLG